jgi:hypothetical protein
MSVVSIEEFEEVCAERDALHQKVLLLQKLLSDARAEATQHAASRDQLEALSTVHAKLSAEHESLLEQNRMLETFGRQVEQQQVAADRQACAAPAMRCCE